MSQNALNQSVTSRSFTGNSGASSGMVTPAQVMQFLGRTAEGGGSNGLMAQDVLQLMQHTPALSAEISPQLAPVVQLIAPKAVQVAEVLDTVCTRYQPQIAVLNNSQNGRVAGGELARTLQTLPAAQGPEGQRLLRQLQQGRLPHDEALQSKLAGLLDKARPGDTSARLPQLLRQLVKGAPEAGEILHKIFSGEEKKTAGEKENAASDSLSEGKTSPERQTEDEQTVTSFSPPVQQREGQRQSSSDGEPQREEDEDGDMTVKGGAAARQGADVISPSSPCAAADVSGAPFGSLEGRALAVNLIFPPGLSTVNQAQAQKAAGHILQNSQISLSALVEVPLDGLLLQAATLGLKTFSNTADAVSKSIKINGDAQARLTDKKVADMQDQLAKAREQEHKSKKAKFWSAIFSPITTLLKFVFKPVVDLIKKIPGVEQAFNWIQKNISEIALPLAIISSLVCPMSLPMMLGILATTTVTAGFSIANKIMGDKAPSWLKVTDQIGDMVAGMAMMVATGSMFGYLGKAVRGVEQLFNFLGSKAQTLKNLSAGIQAFTSVGDGVSQYVIGSQLAKLQKELGDIEAEMGLDEMQADWLKSAQSQAVSNLENILNRSATVSESASKAIAEAGSIRARLANAIV